MGKYKFQVQLAGKWENYSDEENGILCRAYMSGSKKAQYHLRGNSYQYEFTTMEQVNQDSGKRRRIRPPPNLKPPQAPLVPPGPTMMVVVPAHARPGDMMEVPHPQNKSVKLQVLVPPGARAGATLLVPVPPAPAPVVQQYAIAAPAVPQSPAAAPQPSTPSSAPQQPPTPTAPSSKHDGSGDRMQGALIGAGGMAAVGGVLVGVGAATGNLGNVGDGLVHATEATGDAIGDGAQAVGEFLEPAIEEMGELANDAGDFIMNLF